MPMGYPQPPSPYLHTKVDLPFPIKTASLNRKSSVPIANVSCTTKRQYLFSFQKPVDPNAAQKQVVSSSTLPQTYGLQTSPL